MSTDNKINEIHKLQIAGRAGAEAQSPVIKELAASVNALREEIQVNNWLIIKKLDVSDEELKEAVAWASNEADAKLAEIMANAMGKVKNDH